MEREHKEMRFRMDEFMAMQGRLLDRMDVMQAAPVSASQGGEPMVRSMEGILKFLADKAETGVRHRQS